MTTITDVLTAIRDGDLDDDLARISDAIAERRFRQGEVSPEAVRTVAILNSLFNGTPDKGALSDLVNHAAGRQGPFPALTRATRHAPENVLWAHETVAGLFGLANTARTEPVPTAGSFGWFARTLAAAPNSRLGVERMFERVLACSQDQLPRQIAAAIRRGRSSNVNPPAWARLIDDLARWNDPAKSVQRAWARDFYQ